MPFKTKEFKKTRFTYRTESVLLPDLKDWFDGPPEWTVKGLSGNELGHCRELAERNRKVLSATRDYLSQPEDNGLISEVRRMEGKDGRFPMDNAYRVEFLIAGSLDPECDIDLAVKLNTTFPTEFQILTKKILQLTGMGYEPGK